MYGFGGVGLSEVQISISELSVVGGGGRDKRTSWSDLVGVRQISSMEALGYSFCLFVANSFLTK